MNFLHRSNRPAQAITQIAQAILLLILVVNISNAQTEQQPSEAVIEVRTKIVTVDAQVINSQNGEVINGLKKEDFVLFDNGVQQEITNFSQEELPLSVILLLDLNRDSIAQLIISGN